jgi:hypothetical protein
MLAQSCASIVLVCHLHSCEHPEAEIPHKHNCIKSNRKYLAAAALHAVTIDRGAIEIRRTGWFPRSELVVG